MKRTSPLLLIFAATALSAHAATTIVNDTFTDGDVVDGADATDTAWYSYHTGAAATLSVASDATLGGGNALNLNNAASTFKGVGANYANTTLAVGETLSLSFDFRFTEGPGNNSGGLRLGLGNQVSPGSASTGTGYYVSLGTGTSTGLSFNKDLGVDSFTSGTVTALTTVQTGTPSPFAVTGTGSHTVNFSVSRTISGYDLSFVLDGGTAYTASDDGSGIAPSFNFLALVEGGISSDFRIDNVNVTQIPEPSVALLGGLGLLALLRRRRA